MDPSLGHLLWSTLSLFFFLATLGLCCCMQAFPSYSEQRLLASFGYGLLTEVASLVREHELYGI